MLITATESANSTTQFEVEPGVSVPVNVIPGSQFSDSHLRILDQTIGQSTLNDVMAKFSGSRESNSGDAAGSVKTVCLIGKDKSVVAFESGEMGSAKAQITKVKLQSAPTTSTQEPACTPSRSVNRHIKLAGTGLNWSRQQIEKDKGTPSAKLGDCIYYVYNSTQQSKSKTRVVDTMLKVCFTNGRSNRIELSRIETHEPH